MKKTLPTVALCALPIVVSAQDLDQPSQIFTTGSRILTEEVAWREKVLRLGQFSPFRVRRYATY